MMSGSEAYETAVEAVGGSDLEAAYATLREAREALEATFSPEQRALNILASDARSDHATVREEAVRILETVHGIAIGAALAVCPDEDPAVLTRWAGEVALGALCRGVGVAETCRAGRAILAALERVA